jgi:RNA ligase
MDEPANLRVVLPYGTHADMVSLSERVAQKYVARREHPTLNNVAIYNYTAPAQYEKAWDDHVLQARGLVCHDSGEILARPLPKFFNHDELQVLPWHLPFEVTTKMDGSMFLLRVLPDGTKITATRGSFMSEQAEAGRVLLDQLYPSVIFDPTVTYIFELIHPDFRIVVDYGDRKDLVLLAMIETDTGRELSLDEAPAGVHVVERHKFQDIGHADHLLALETTNAEGFVVRFADGTRAKVKFSEYKRLHRIVTGVSSRTIWEYLRDGRPIQEIVENVPDEFHAFVEEWVNRLKSEYARIATAAQEVAERVRDLPSRREQAAIITKLDDRRVTPVAFLALDGKPLDATIWKLIEPDYVPPPFAARAEAA